MKLTHDVKGKTERYVIAPRKGNPSGLPARRSWKLNVLNASRPKSVKINGKSTEKADWEYIAADKTLTLSIPETDCALQTEIKVKY